MSFSRIHDSPPITARIWAVVAFLVVGLAVYGASLRNEFVRWDDGLLIFENPVVREQSLRSVGRAFTTYDPELYIPLTLLTYKIDYAVGGINPTSYRVQNLLWHTASALLVAWIAWLLIGSPWALVAGLLFLIHPLNTEAVAWASARKDVVSVCFALASIVAYLSARREAEAATRRSRRLLAWSAGFFLLALLAKVVVVLLPLILLLLDWLTGRRVTRGSVMEKWPFFLLSLLFGVIALFGKREMIEGLSLWPSVLVALRSTTFFLQKLLWPAGLSVMYPYDGPISLLQPAFLLSLIAVVALLGLAFGLRRRAGLVTVAVAWMFLFLLPTFTNFYKGGVVYLFSDRYGYLPAVGIFLLVAWVADRAVRAAGTLRAERLRSNVALGASVLVFLLLCVQANAQAATWKNSEALFTQVIRYYPRSWVARSNLAAAYRRRREYALAREQLEAALDLRPQDPTAAQRKGFGEIHLNLGDVSREQGRLAEALIEFNLAAEENPESAGPYVGRGLVYLDQGDPVKALDQYDRAIALNPQSVQALVNRGVLKYKTADTDGAIADFRAALEVQPDLADAHYNLALALEKKGEKEAAADAYRSAIAAKPQAVPPRINLGLLLFNTGDRSGSRTVFRDLLKVDPGNRAAVQALEQIGE